MKKQVINIGALGQKPDYKMSKEEMLEDCVSKINWIIKMLFGDRDSAGKLIKKGDDYSIGLLQKIEGVYELNEETQQPELKQVGMEQLWGEIKNMVEALIFEKQIQQAILGVMLKIDPNEMAEYFDKHEAEVNKWITNYKSSMHQNLARVEKEEKENIEKSKKFTTEAPNEK